MESLRVAKSTCRDPTRRQLTLVIAAVTVLVVFMWKTSDRHDFGQLAKMAEVRLVEDVRNNYLNPPSDRPYELEHPEIKDPTQFNQTHYILTILKHLRNGFFVECGAFTGEKFSNTLYLERFLGWGGLLIEPNSVNFKTLTTKHRKAWTINTCLNDANNKSVKNITIEKAASEMVVLPTDKKTPKNTAQVVCFPLEAMLSALGRTRVDYFSLDVEGQELAILKSIPFDKLDIRTLSIETNHSPGGRRAIVDLMSTRGYTEVEHIHIDSIMVKSSAFPELISNVQSSLKQV